MCDWLIATSAGKPEDIHVAIEVPHGAVVETLLDRGFKVYSINPRQLDRFRDRFSPAGAKDDSRDAETLSSSLRTDRRAFHQVALAGPAIIELREWSRMADDLSADKIRQTNRLREQLQRYYPQMLRFDSDLAEEWVLMLWEAAPIPAKAAQLRRAEVEILLKRHRIRRISAAEVLAILKEQALIVAPGVTEAAVAHIRVLIESIRLFTQQLKEAHRQLDRLCKLLAEPTASKNEQTGPEPEQNLVAIIQSLPGAGRIVLSTLLAEAFEPLQRADYPILRKLCGVAPKQKSGSGAAKAATHLALPLMVPDKRSQRWRNWDFLLRIIESLVVLLPPAFALECAASRSKCPNRTANAGCSPDRGFRHFANRAPGPSPRCLRSRECRPCRIRTRHRGDGRQHLPVWPR
jgi:hypothetical protein